MLLLLAEQLQLHSYRFLVQMHEQYSQCHIIVNIILLIVSQLQFSSTLLQSWDEVMPGTESCCWQITDG